MPQAQTARGSKKFILAQTHEKTIPQRTKISFSLEIFILGLKLSFSIENFNPRPCFSAAREGPGMKISFSIENFIPYWKLFFQYRLSRLNFFNPGALWGGFTIIPLRQVLSGPDGCRHSSDQHPKDVNSENSNYCPILSGNLCPPEGKLPRCGISVFLQCLNFCPTYREAPEPPGDGNSNFLSSLSFVALSCSGLV